MKIQQALAIAAAALVAALFTPSVGRAQQLPEEGIKVEAPVLPTGLKWHNSPPLTMEQLKGKVVLLDFWEYTCVNCIRTLSYLKKWHEKYKDKGLVILGVHTPEFQFAKSEANVLRAVKEFGLAYPIVVDSAYAVWQSYGNRYWPAKYLIDKAGFVRYFHFGEGAYESTEARIQKLLKDLDPNVELPPITGAIRGADKPGAVCYPVTPELYLGFERGGHEGTLGNSEGYQPGKVVAYKDPGGWKDGMIYVNGAWRNQAEALVSTRKLPHPKEFIAIRYHALEVNSVLRPENGKPVRIYLYQDGKPVAKADKGDDVRYDAQGRSYLLLDQPRMYNLIKNAKFGQRTLKLATAEPGMGIYSFTFVSCEKAK
ncbi:MAG: redoxin domain-containing protein [Armatimonadetes bacterium]|nr:redoxin domain-containing protein [Armatimonadota bacterium]